jgi:3-methyladenine DNA glycosylase/8-oxoguanine DNA glycosylase
MPGAGSWRGVRLFTIGHSTRTADELISILRAFDVSIVADIRTIPRSRHNPQFEGKVLGATLRRHQLRYVHLPALGGLRHARKDSPNPGWHNASFRGFADYMLTDDFEAGLAELRRLTAGGTVALMCAEAVPWRCHRSLVADALVVRGARVEHIASAGHAASHQLTEFAQVDGGRVTYPDDGSSLETRAPFHLEATVRVLQRRPTNLVDVWEDGRYLRVLTTPDGPVLVEVVNLGTIARPRVRCHVLAGGESRDTRAAAVRLVRAVLGLDVDPRPLQRLLEAERKLGAVALALRGMRPPRFPGLFETFANVIPFQQLSLDAGVAVVRRLVERFGQKVLHQGRERYAFPAAAAIAGARLDAIRACGLSARKAEALRGAAVAVEAGDLTEAKLLQLGSADALRLLADLPVIGSWSAAVILLRGLRRLDVFPPGDVGVIRGLTGLMHVQPGSPLDRVIHRFGDRRGYLYFCSLGGALLAKGLIHPAVAVSPGVSPRAPGARRRRGPSRAGSEQASGRSD